MPITRARSSASTKAKTSYANPTEEPKDSLNRVKRQVSCSNALFLAFFNGKFKLKSATTISAYFTSKRRNKGWSRLEGQLIQWIVSQNMDSVLDENPHDADLLEETMLCKEIQRSFNEKDKAYQYHIPKESPSKLAGKTLPQIPELESTPGGSEIEWTYERQPEIVTRCRLLADDRYMQLLPNAHRGDTESRIYIAESDRNLLALNPALILNLDIDDVVTSQWCLLDGVDEASNTVVFSELTTDFHNPYANYYSQGKREAVELYG